MSLHSDLLAQAEHLAKREPKKPRQASLRRAVSAASYALFHMLTSTVTTRLVPKSPEILRQRAQRAFNHCEMKTACEQFAKPIVGGTAGQLVHTPIEPEFQRVAAAFITLQQARHVADYDLSQKLDRVSVLQTIDLAKNAFSNWKAVQNTPNANVFLTNLLIGTRWGR